MPIPFERIPQKKMRLQLYVHQCITKYVTPNLAVFAERISHNIADKATAIVEYYNALAAAKEQPEGKLAQAVCKELILHIKTERNFPQEPLFFPMTYAMRDVGKQLTFLKKNGLKLDSCSPGKKFRSRSCRFTNVCNWCMSEYVTPYLAKLMIPADKATAIVKYYEFLKAAEYEPEEKLTQAVYNACKQLAYYSEP